ncbi:MAG: chorismate synthase [Chloroflexi bacterium]|nr:chorismate synthase [Chloroflexota bacterium]
MPLRFLTAGESHGPGLVAILEGLPAGLVVDEDALAHMLARRQQGVGSGPRMRIERDRARILSGVLAGKTTGAPIALWIPNRDHAKWRGKAIPPFTTPRPGHGDLAAALKYGYTDLRPGLERASARETAARVAVGALCIQFLRALGIQVQGYVIAIGSVQAQNMPATYAERWAQAEANPVRCPDPEAAAAMSEAIARAMRARETLGGVIEVVATGVPPGLGSHVHWDRRLDARLAAAVMSVPAIKAVSLGNGWEQAQLLGTQAHDPIRLEGRTLVRPSNRAGGVEAGISNGQPLVVRAAMKPIPTTLKPQPTVDVAAGQETATQYERSDFCPVPRAVPVIEAMVAFVLADAVLEKVGGDTMEEVQARFAALPWPSLDALRVTGEPHRFWPEDATELPSS